MHSPPRNRISCCISATTSTRAPAEPERCDPWPARRPYPWRVTRQRYAQYKTDPDLQAAHAVAPWLVVWDDHEVDNNYADEVPESPPQQPHDAFLARRAAAYQAYQSDVLAARSHEEGAAGRWAALP